MRVFVLTAFFALQLSVFTCGFGIHVYAMDSDAGQVTQHQHADKDNNDVDHGCHVHTSHTFIEFDVAQAEEIPLIFSFQHYMLAEPNLKKIPFLIEYPPKSHYG